MSKFRYRLNGTGSWTVIDAALPHNIVILKTDTIEVESIGAAALSQGSLPQFASMVGFGDSFIAGSNATAAANRLLNIVATALGAGTPLNKGIGGTVLQNSFNAGGSPAVNNGRDRFEADLLGANKREAVLIGYGGNDARYVAAPATLNVANYLIDYRQILNGLIVGGYDPAKIIICTPWWLSDVGLQTGNPGFFGQTRAGFEEFVNAAISVAREYGTWLCDTYAYFRDHGGASLVDTDNIHPANAGHAVLAEGILATSAIANIRTAPTNVVVTSPNAGEINVAFTGVEGAVSYTVQYGAEGAFFYTTTKDVTTASAFFNGVVGGSYRVRLRANFADGSSRWIFASSAVAVVTNPIFFSDTFTGDADTSLLDHAPDLGQAWTTQTGHAPASPARLSGAGRLYGTDAANVYRSASATSSNNQVTGYLECLSVVANDNVGVTTRASSSQQTYYFARYNRAVSGWQLFRVVNGAAAQIGSNFADTWTTGLRTVRLKAVGTTISMLVDVGGGLVERVSATDNTITSGAGIGVRMAGAIQTASTGIQIDRLEGEAV